jgi:hypothetical protein
LSKNCIHQIEQDGYEKVRSIFSELARIHLHITAILDGNSPGAVFVDDVEQPQTAHIVSGAGYYVAGFPNNHGYNLALNAALPLDTYFVLFCVSHHWESALETVLKNTYAIRAGRRCYTLRELRIADWQDRVPDGFLMRRIDAELLAEGLKHCDSVAAGIGEEWCSVEAFMENGFGFCLVHGDEIISWSFSDYVSGDRCEMGINTGWHYRRRGLGTLTATATAADARACGFSNVGWHCWTNNVGSIGVAENVGFVKTAEYDVHINHWAAENVTDMTQAEFDAFAQYYERELESHPPVSGFPHIVTAKAWALSGDWSGCYRHLNKAVDIGWLRSVDHLREIWPEFFWNPDLDVTEEWQELVMRFEGGGA